MPKITHLWNPQTMFDMLRIVKWVVSQTQGPGNTPSPDAECKTETNRRRMTLTLASSPTPTCVWLGAGLTHGGGGGCSINPCPPPPHHTLPYGALSYVVVHDRGTPTSPALPISPGSTPTLIVPGKSVMRVQKEQEVAYISEKNFPGANLTPI